MKKADISKCITDEAVNALKRCAIELRALNPSPVLPTKKTHALAYPPVPINTTEIRNSCLASRMNHNGERFFQNMTFWDSDAGINVGDRSKMFNHLLYLTRLVNCEHITLANIDKLNKETSFYIYFCDSLEKLICNSNSICNVGRRIRINELFEIEKALEKIRKIEPDNKRYTELSDTFSKYMEVIAEIASCDEEIII